MVSPRDCKEMVELPKEAVEALTDYLNGISSLLNDPDGLREIADKAIVREVLVRANDLIRNAFIDEIGGKR